MAGASRAGLSEDPRFATGYDLIFGKKGEPFTHRERLDKYYELLGALPPARNAEEGLARVRDTLDHVEDLYSGVPKKTPPPAIGQSDGRLYPPLEDRVTRHPDGSITARTAGHHIEIGKDGSIEMTHRRTGKVDFEQLGGGQ